MEKEATGVPKGPPKLKCCDLILEWTCRDRQGALGAGGLKRTKVFMEREQFGMKASMGSGRGKAANTKPHSTHSSEPLLCYFHPKTGNCLNRTLNRSSFQLSRVRAAQLVWNSGSSCISLSSAGITGCTTMYGISKFS
jgi:hypothetical protein